MKKIFLSVLAIAAMATTANAQLWLGGSVSFSHSDSKREMDNTKLSNPSSNSFSFSPMVGFELNEQLSVGGKLNLSTRTDKSSASNGAIEDEQKNVVNSVSATPFARYKFAEFNKFGLVAEAGLPIGTALTKADNGINTQKSQQTSISLYVAPLLTYSLNDHFQLECGLNFLSLSANHSVTKDRDNSKNKNTSNSFRFGANTDNVVTVGNITIGFIYRL